MVCGCSQELLFKQQKLLAMSDEGVVRVVGAAQKVSHKAGKEPDPSFPRAQKEEKQVISRAEQRTQDKAQGQKGEDEDPTKCVESTWAESKRRHEAKRAAEAQRLKAVRYQLSDQQPLYSCTRVVQNLSL